MNLANLLNLSNVEMGLIMVEGSVLLSLFIILICFWRVLRQRRNEKPLKDSYQMKKWVLESEVICKSLSRNLEEKKEIANQLILQLEKKIKSLDVMIKKIEGEISSLSEGGKKKDLTLRILEMAENGRDVSDIARDLHLSKGEVQLALDLEKYRQ
jgi:cell division protein YceG involved in septum cleavage